MLRKPHILTILWLGLLSSPLLYAAESCQTDSMIGYSENSTPVSKILYQYDEAGRTLKQENWTINSDSVLVGQNRTINEYYDNGKLKSTSQWIWTVDNNTWYGTERHDYQYDQKGNTIMSAYLTWSSNTNGWVNYSKTESIFNSSNKEIQSITYIGNDLEWIPQTKREYDYDAAGNEIEIIVWDTYDAATETWIGKSWQKYKYDNKKLVLDELYNWLDGKWIGNHKFEYGYNSAGIKISTIGYRWNKDTSSFVPNYKLSSSYDDWDNITYCEEYSWVDGAWLGLQKFRIEYIDDGETPIMSANFQWDKTKGEFVGVDSMRADYDINQNQILDEQYTWSGNDWAGSKKEEYIYDSNKLILSTIAYKWDVVNKKWDNNTKVLADYNTNKMQILDERYQWITENGGYWKGTKKDSTVYNTKNEETESFSFQWDDENHRWLGNTKYRKEFDAANNLILEEQYKWQMVDTMAAGGFWKGIKKEEYAYNAAKQQTLAIIYAWSDAIEDWIGNTKKISDFDSNKNQTLNEQYTWVKVDSMASGGYWQGTEKATYTFNKNKQQTSSWVYAWNDADTAWVYSTRDTASYDSKKNQTLDERYTYDVTNQAWVGTLKKEYAYNASGQQIMFAYYQWDNENEKWIGTQKEEDEQDAEGRTILKATYTWGTDIWVGKSKDTYTYFRNDTVAEHITYVWQETKWVEKSLIVDNYNDEGVHTLTATYIWKNNSWVGTKMMVWAYTTSGKLWIQEDYVWGTTDWVKSTRLENTYADDKLTAYTTFMWDGGAWVNVKHWEQVDVNTERTYEWYNNTWSVTQETKKEYDEQGRIKTETDQNWSHGVQTAGSKTEYTYAGSNLTQKSSYTYDSGISDWVETSRERKEFDTNGHQTLSIQETYKGGVTISGTMTENTYDADGNLTNTTQSTCNNDVWSYVSKTDNEYNGKTTITTNYTSPDGMTWQGVDKQEKEYGEGKDVTITQYEWSTLLTNWVGTSKTGYTYYDNGKEKSVIDYRWTGSDWVADTKTEFEYSGSKNIVTATYSWENDTWVGQTKIGYYYDEGEDLTTATWDWKDGTWVGNTKMGETFDQFGNRTGQTTYTWNGTDFVYKQKTQIEYGISSKDKTTAIYNWDGTAWVGVSKSGVTYNGSKISSQIEYKWISGFDWEYTKKTEYEYGTNANDKTTATYVWDATIPDWVGESKSGVTYASNGKIGSEFSYVWGGTDWIGVKKTEYEYGDGKNNSVAQYVWGDSTWIGVTKVEEKYLDKGDPLSAYTYCWKNGDWSDSLKTEYTYDDHGNTIYYVQAKIVYGEWSNLGTSTWWEVAYDEKDSVILDAHYTWNVSKNRWVGKGRKNEYTYDEEGRIILHLQYNWSSKVWVGLYKKEWKYDEYGNEILMTYQQYDNTKKVWYGLQKNEHAYDKYGNETMNASYGWSDSRKDWEGNSRNDNLFNEHGEKIGNVTFAWDYTKWKWKGLFKYEQLYDEKDNLISSTISSYSAETEEWQYNTRTLYKYDSYGRNVEIKTENWSSDGWWVRSIQSVEYDVYPHTRLRSTINASWINGITERYEEIFYYYACDPKFTITVTTQEEGVGNTEGSGIYTYYARPKISAKIDNCAEFSQWDDGDKNATRRVLVTEDKTYTAIFSPVKHTIRASVRLDSGGSAGGSVRVTLKPKK